MAMTIYAVLESWGKESFERYDPTDVNKHILKDYLLISNARIIAEGSNDNKMFLGETIGDVRQDVINHITGIGKKKYNELSRQELIDEIENIRATNKELALGINIHFTNQSNINDLRVIYGKEK
ncbi:unnamed protein product [marine sediment metagenome]|uniref:Uncharacterized protein n=1 Tax=marine sediment metagenome TaxID=412755 RepID=X1KFH2_9ZZZZ